MARDIQYDILDHIRDAGYAESGVLYLSRTDAERLLKGLPEPHPDLTGPEDIERYEGTRDVAGVITYRLDDELQAGTAQILSEEGIRIPVVLHGI